jgi:hypothetical protein
MFVFSLFFPRPSATSHPPNRAHKLAKFSVTAFLPVSLLDLCLQATQLRPGATNFGVKRIEIRWIARPQTAGDCGPVESRLACIKTSFLTLHLLLAGALQRDPLGPDAGRHSMNPRVTSL